MACFRVKILSNEEWAWKREHKVRFIRIGITSLRLKSRSKNLFVKTDLRTCKTKLCN